VIEERGNYCENCFADGRRVKKTDTTLFSKVNYPNWQKKNGTSFSLPQVPSRRQEAVHIGNDKLRRKCEQMHLPEKMEY
jgi:hypothetical protein